MTRRGRGAAGRRAVRTSAFARPRSRTSGYYLLSFESPDRDASRTTFGEGNPPGVTVRARPQFAVAAAFDRSIEEQLVDALKNPLPVADVGLKVTTFTYRDDG